MADIHYHTCTLCLATYECKLAIGFCDTPHLCSDCLLKADAPTQTKVEAKVEGAGTCPSCDTEFDGKDGDVLDLKACPACLEQTCSDCRHSCTDCSNTTELNYCGECCEHTCNDCMMFCRCCDERICSCREDNHGT